ncbi:hypothetical protein GHK86_16520 [Acidimicrobiaceae bacterium USS-CC1]|uniref:Polyketide antibiotic transporter n=1 Tax=Acidiferrimicrobium australe TaxID=2664430 RepID=A0ABW9QWT2_9ACTN|nr:hypothetical protein [Acidiferrimicrobium australe]
MATDLATGPVPAPAPVATGPAPPAEPLHAERASTGLALRQIWIGGLVVVASLGLLLWAGTTAYRKSAETGGGLMTALASNPAVRAIYGLPTALTTIGGFAVWRVELFVMLLGAVWMTLATTRVVRGDEESGRLDLVLANPLSLTRSTGASLTALLAVPFLAALVVGAVLDGSGAQPAGSWLYGVGIGLLIATFLAVAALASQLVPERRRATGLAVGVVFVTFVLRMWADGSSSAGWARWLTPFGWVEDLHAFGGNDLLPLVPLVLAPVVLVAVTFVVARGRDVGAGVIRADDRKEGGTALLSGPLAFAARRRIGELAGWVAALAVLGVLSGGLAESLVGFPTSQPEATAMLDRMGMGAAVTPAGFVAIMNVFYAVVLSGYGIASVHGDYEDETTSRLDLPYSNRVTRTRWAGSTVVTTVAALAVLTAVLGFATWVASAAAQAGLSAGDSFASAANVLAVPILFLGLAVLLHGLRPSWAVSVTGILAVGLYLVDLIGPALSWPTWLVDLSPYHHLALVPAEPAAWAPLAVILGIGLVAGAVGLAAYARRDLE